MQVDFYHLTVAPIDRVLPRIAERVLADGGRLLIVADQARLPALDKLLWTWRADSFLPHDCAGGDRDADQPILLSADTRAANTARNIAIADGAWRDAALDFDRAHMSQSVCSRPECVAWAQSKVAGFTNETATYYPFGVYKKSVSA